MCKSTHVVPKWKTKIGKKRDKKWGSFTPRPCNEGVARRLIIIMMVGRVLTMNSVFFGEHVGVEQVGFTPCTSLPELLAQADSSPYLLRLIAYYAILQFC